MASVTEIIENAKKVEPIAEKNGRKIVTFEDAAALADREGIEPTPKTGQRTYNPDGSLARLRRMTAAINPSRYFLNRYKETSKKRIKVVIDYRAIMEQASGTVYLTAIPAYVFARNDEGKLYIEKIETISDTEFISDYTKQLNQKAMEQIAPLIADFGSDVTASDLPI